MKIFRKIFITIFTAEFLLICFSFDLLVEKISYDICGADCRVREIEVEKESYKKKDHKENSISIPKINIKAPVIFNAGISEDQVLEGMHSGVVFYASSNLPNEKGLSMYLGHSSNYFWQKGDYNNIFALIPELKAGDKIEIIYDDQEYIYQVRTHKVIGKSAWQEIKNPGYDTGLVLITCWPLGSTWKRYVLFAERVN